MDATPQKRKRGVGSPNYEVLPFPPTVTEARLTSATDCTVAGTGTEGWLWVFIENTLYVWKHGSADDIIESGSNILYELSRSSIALDVVDPRLLCVAPVRGTDGRSVIVTAVNRTGQLCTGICRPTGGKIDGFGWMVVPVTMSEPYTGEQLLEDAESATVATMLSQSPFSKGQDVMLELYVGGSLGSMIRYQMLINGGMVRVFERLKPGSSADAATGSLGGMIIGKVASLYGSWLGGSGSKSSSPVSAPSVLNIAVLPATANNFSVYVTLKQGDGGVAVVKYQTHTAGLTKKPEHFAVPDLTSDIGSAYTVCDVVAVASTLTPSFDRLAVLCYSDSTKSYYVAVLHKIDEALQVVGGVSRMLSPPANVTLPPPFSSHRVPLARFACGVGFVGVCFIMPSTTASALAKAARKELTVATTVVVCASYLVDVVSATSWTIACLEDTDVNPRSPEDYTLRQEAVGCGPSAANTESCPHVVVFSNCAYARVHVKPTSGLVDTSADAVSFLETPGPGQFSRLDAGGAFSTSFIASQPKPAGPPVPPTPASSILHDGEEKTDDAAVSGPGVFAVTASGGRVMKRLAEPEEGAVLPFRGPAIPTAAIQIKPGDACDRNLGPCLRALFGTFKGSADSKLIESVLSLHVAVGADLDKIIVNLSKEIVDKRPTVGQTWATGGDVAGLGASTVRTMRVALDQKGTKVTNFLRFLRLTGLWSLLSPAARIELVEHGEKLAVAMFLATLDLPAKDTQPSPSGYSLASVLFDALMDVVERRRGVKEETRRKAGLTLQDVFYSEISRIAELFLALKDTVSTIDLDRLTDVNQLSYTSLLSIVNKIVVGSVEEAIHFRERYAESAYDVRLPARPNEYGVTHVWWTASPTDVLPCLRLCLDKTDDFLWRLPSNVALQGQLPKVFDAVIHAWCPTGTQLPDSPYRDECMTYMVERLAKFPLPTNIPKTTLKVARSHGDMEAVVRICEAIDASQPVPPLVDNAFAREGSKLFLSQLEGLKGPLATAAVQVWLELDLQPRPMRASSKILRLPPAYDAEVLSVLRSDPESELKRNVLALFLLKRGLSAGTNPRSLQQSADISMRMGHEVAKDPNPDGAGNRVEAALTAISIAKLALLRSKAPVDVISQCDTLFPALDAIRGQPSEDEGGGAGEPEVTRTVEIACLNIHSRDVSAVMKKTIAESAFGACVRFLQLNLISQEYCESLCVQLWRAVLFAELQWATSRGLTLDAVEMFDEGSVLALCLTLPIVSTLHEISPTQVSDALVTLDLSDIERVTMDRAFPFLERRLHHLLRQPEDTM